VVKPQIAASREEKDRLSFPELLIAGNGIKTTDWAYELHAHRLSAFVNGSIYGGLHVSAVIRAHKTTWPLGFA